MTTFIMQIAGPVEWVPGGTDHPCPHSTDKNPRSIPLHFTISLASLKAAARTFPGPSTPHMTRVIQNLRALWTIVVGRSFPFGISLASLKAAPSRPHLHAAILLLRSLLLTAQSITSKQHAHFISSSLFFSLYHLPLLMTMEAAPNTGRGRLELRTVF
jgi:hypothetical protein